MSNLIAKLPSVRRPDGPSHQRLDSPPPSPHNDTDVSPLHEDAAEPLTPMSPSSDKGKAVDPSERGGRSRSHSSRGDEDSSLDDREPMVPQEAADEARTKSPTESYPPMNDQDLESRRVQENLRHWELLEKQRRKAARDSRSIRTPSTIFGDVFRRFSGGVTSPTRDGFTEVASKDEEELQVRLKSPPPPPPKATVQPTSKSKKHRSNTTASRISEVSIKTTDTESTVTSGPSNPFSNPKPKLLVDAPQTSSTPEDDPFKNPDGNSSKVDLPLLSSSPTVLTPETSPRLPAVQNLQVPPTQLSKRRSHTAPPAAKPLDLPEPRMPSVEPTPGTGHWRRVQEARVAQQELMQEEERDKTEGRWWTDWLCGCRENRYREEQDGRTNPFE